ncbi:MAG TPA: flavodoxin family protein [Sedimentisphaerales bacterium]|nr:flavodoxin family protein [Sedimentisphaerales bacterium]HRS12559.1 flavodoxin family protein [Sedimentisphaerales bacterium]HRV49193.1 flavodoxin family protein [Sedimentisphaerales bacterium]
MNRRKFLTATLVAGTAVSATSTDTVAQDRKPLKIVGISCSPRRAKTTAAALTICLEAAKAVDPAITTELIELAGRNIGVYDPADPKASQGGFADLIPVLSDPSVGGIIIGTPVYFGNMSSLCKAFLDHCMAFRQQSFALSGKVGGIVAVGAARNGGQELAIQSVHAALLCQEMIVVGDARPTGHLGATLVNSNDDINQDEFGIGTARNLGRRVAEVARKLTPTRS